MPTRERPKLFFADLYSNDRKTEFTLGSLNANTQNNILHTTVPVWFVFHRWPVNGLQRHGCSVRRQRTMGDIIGDA